MCFSLTCLSFIKLKVVGHVYVNKSMFLTSCKYCINYEEIRIETFDGIGIFKKGIQPHNLAYAFLDCVNLKLLLRVRSFGQ